MIRLTEAATLASRASTLAQTTHPEGRTLTVTRGDADAFLKTRGKGRTYPTYALLSTLRGHPAPASLPSTLRARGTHGRKGTALLTAEAQIRGMQG